VNDPERTNGAPVDNLAAALDYIARGWTVVPLHHIEHGLCTCGNPDPEHTRRQGGKHPIYANWQLASLHDAGSVAAYWTAHPSANVGIATGRASRIWVLDIDPDNGGDVALQGLIEANGALPLTRKHQTGSGGYHLVWRMPPDFEPTNSRGRLPRGLDVRGTGGQIVAPPSESGKGGYLVIADVEIVDAPAWLLDLIRPATYEPSNVVRGSVETIGTYGPGQDHRVNAYASKTMQARCDELARAPEGLRNDTAFRVACRLWELVNAGWVPRDGAHGRYIEACAAADAASGAGSSFPEAEAESVWHKAWRKVGGTAAVMPDDMMHGEVFPFGQPAPGVSLTSTGAPAGTGEQAGEGSTQAGLFVDPGATGAATSMQQGLPAQTGGVQQMQHAPIEMLRARLRTGAEFAALPPPRPLVAGLLDLESIAYMIGKSGSYKSFIALDLACHVACDMPWRGRRVHGGTVLYLCAEGQSGAHLRVGAWMRTHGRQDTGQLLVLDLPVQARDPVMWTAFTELCRELGPVLVVIDTQARCSLGFEENSNSDMSLFVGQVDALREATGACVLVIHHIGRNGSAARGASAIDGAQDAELRVERGAVPLSCTVSTDKEKDRPDNVAIPIKLDVVAMGWNPLTGEDITSLVVSADVPQELNELEALAIDTSTWAGKLADVAARHFASGNGGTKTEMLAVLREKYGKSDRSTEFRAWQKCLEEQVFERVQGLQSFRYVPVADRATGDTERVALERVDAIA
jgi:hypothetical protein